MEILIEKYDHNGRGIGYINNKVIFVPNTLVGDIVEIDVIKSKKNYDEAIIKKIIKKSPIRKEVICPYFNNCGGCQFLNTTYNESIKYKKEKIINILKKLNINVEPIIIESDKDLHYRNKISLKVVNGVIGFFERKSNKIIKIEECLISKESINDILPLINKFEIDNGNITIRQNYQNELLIIIDTFDKININEDMLKERRNIAGVILNNRCIYGKDFFVEKIGELSFNVSYDSFFQINPYITNKLFNIINENISVNANVLDLYCGVGTLSLVAAKKAKEVLGIEIIPNAIDNANKNAILNNCVNTKFILGDVENIIDKINFNFDTLIVDPPRKGLDVKSRNLIIKSKVNNIIYVSCDPLTLSRDLKELLDFYDIKKLFILDMFCYTYHVESVILLHRKD